MTDIADQFIELDRLMIEHNFNVDNRARLLAMYLVGILPDDAYAELITFLKSAIAAKSQNSDSAGVRTQAPHTL